MTDAPNHGSPPLKPDDALRRYANKPDDAKAQAAVAARLSGG